MERSLVFNSLVFLEFAALFFLGFWFVRDKKPWNYAYLILMSCLFYGYAGWWFVPLLLLTASVDYWMAQAIHDRPEHKKLLLIISLVSNLGVLGLFKYSGWFAEGINSAAQGLGLQASLPVLHFALPVGISFYTFQSLSYVFDVYRGETKPARSILHFLSIVTLFPHLVAGPIVRVSHILPQIEVLPKATPTMVWDGFQLIAFGLFKKMVIADNLAPYVDSVYGGATPGNAAAYTLATVAFAFQIYHDFSGYTDIARGLAKWIGLEFTLNFNHPYTAIGFTDFWARWHISLSKWIRDYIFIPLGGSRVPELVIHRNIWVAMLLSGLWHGANVTFVVWGALHALYQSIERITRWPKRISTTLPGRLLGVAITFVMATSAWVFFRALTLNDAFDVFRTVGSGRWSFGSALSALPSAFMKFQFQVAFLLAILIEGYFVVVRHANLKLVIPRPPVRAFLAAAMLVACIYFGGAGQTFIYFAF
ncbi:MBOAT family protein [bacterium]|nr:MAG: MBOAT family protein [bacterium]